MPIDERSVRERCTDAVFERGRKYRDEGRIRRVSRVGDTVTARVQGTRPYDVTVEMNTADPDARCSCPYDGPGECKHVVAVLLQLADGSLPDEQGTVEEVLADLQRDELASFLRDELARNPALRERFLAAFGETPAKTAEDYRAEVDLLFEEHAGRDGVVVEAIDFSRFVELAGTYRERGNARHAAVIYRALAEGIEGNFRLVDANHDYYVETFHNALDGYVECLSAADLQPDDLEEHARFLSNRAETGPVYLRDAYRDALREVRGSGDGVDR